MARATTPKTPTDDAKPVRKISPKEQEFRGLVAELSVVFSDLTLEEVKTLAAHNQIANLSERGTAIQYFWAAKKLNG